MFQEDPSNSSGTPVGQVRHPASFRDPAGFVFRHDGIVYRQVNPSFRADYDQLMSSGAYDRFTNAGWLIRHREVPAMRQQSAPGRSMLHNEPGTIIAQPEPGTIILQPEPVPVISYPSEWSFSMLRDAALLTLRLAIESLNFGLSLKDATPLNIQWFNGELRFIDTLSFERYQENKPWIAYRQFCETFLGPLLLMHYTGEPLAPLSRAWPEGIPVPLTARLLPFRARLSLPVYLHIYLHARVATRSAGADRLPHPADQDQPGPANFSKQKMLNLLTNLESLVTRVRLRERVSTWSAYYQEAAERQGYLEHKKTLVSEWSQSVTACVTATDLGANTGEFSRILAGDKNTERNPGVSRKVLAVDGDASCIGRLYRDRGKFPGVQPMLMDLSNPASPWGVNESEHEGFLDRARADLVLALALVHHLGIGESMTMQQIAELFARVTRRYLVMEFVPAEDEKCRMLLQQKSRTFPEYTAGALLQALQPFFVLMKQEPVRDSPRTLWLLERKSDQTSASSST